MSDFIFPSDEFRPGCFVTCFVGDIPLVCFLESVTNDIYGTRLSMSVDQHLTLDAMEEIANA